MLWPGQAKSERTDCIWPLTLNCDLDLGVMIMNVVRDTPSSDGACVYEVSLNYLERIKSYGPDKQKVSESCSPCDTFCVFICVRLATQLLLCKYKFYEIKAKIAT
jgi:hypothetical protein